MPEPDDAAVRGWGRHLGWHASLYASGIAINATMSLATVAVITRYLPVSVFARMAILIFFSEALAVLYDMGILQGTMRSLLSAGTDSPREILRRRQSLTTGLLVTASVATVVTIVLVVFARPLASLMLHHANQSDLVIYMALNGAALGIYRLVVNHLRYVRRPLAYNSLLVMRGVVTLIVSVILLSQSPTLRSAVLAMALGSAASLLLAIFVLRGLLARTPSWEVLLEIWRLGRPWVPVAFGLWFINTGGIVLLATLSTTHKLGIYRAAVPIAVLVSYANGVVYMSWGPLMRSSAFIAARREVGSRTLNRALGTFYVAGVGGFVAAIAIAQDELVKVTGHAYASAAPLIPLLALPHFIYGIFRLFYLTSESERKVVWFRRLVIAATVVFAGLGVALAGAEGAYGVAAAQFAAFGMAAVLMGRFNFHDTGTLPLDVSKALRGLACGAACVGLDRAVAQTGFSRAAIDLGCLGLLPCLLYAARVFTLDQLEATATVLGGREPRRRREEWLQYLAEMDPAGRRRVRSLVDGSFHPNGATSYSPATGASEDRLSWFAGTVRAMTGGSTNGAENPKLGEYLLRLDSVASRDLLANELIAAGEDPLELDRMVDGVRWLRGLPRRRWRALDRAGSARRRRVERR